MRTGAVAARVVGVRIGLGALRDLVWPASCAACSRPGQRLCVGCARDVAGAGDLRWHSPDPCPTSFPPTATWGAYQGALKALVVAHKDGDRMDAARLLAEPLSEVITLALAGLDDPVLLPIPSAAASRRRRGREPLLDLLGQVRVTREVPVGPALRQCRRVADQARLDHVARRENLHGSMAVAPRWGSVLRGRDVVLVDDVVTTGATLAEATRAIIEDASGGRDVNSLCAAALCATQRTTGGGAAGGPPLGTA